MEEKILALMEKMYAEILNLKDGQLVLAEGYKSLEENARKIGNKLDGEVLTKITALYDDSSVVHEKLNEMNEKIDNLQVRVNNISMDTLINSNKIIELDRRVKNADL